MRRLPHQADWFSVAHVVINGHNILFKKKQKEKKRQIKKKITTNKQKKRKIKNDISTFSQEYLNKKYGIYIKEPLKNNKQIKQEKIKSKSLGFGFYGICF